MTRFIDRIEAAVDHVLAELPGDIVLGTPLGIGKPNPFINALYQRIKAMPARRLKIFTALSLEKPVGRSDVERHFLAPFVERVFGDYPDLDYVKDRRAGRLPPNVEVLEFFVKTGDYLGNAQAQQDYISTNYTFVPRDMALHGVNLLAQAVAERDGALSLSSNCDLTAELVEKLRAMPGHRFMTLACVNEQLPFMPGEAVVPAGFFDVVVREPATSHRLFAPPNMKVSPQDYAIGLHAASLVKDGGTLQIGIGALGDAIAQALLLRDRHNDDYRRMLGALCHGQLDGRELGGFAQGLYGCSEMLVNGLLCLYEAGILRREVFGDAALQTLLNEGRIRAKPDAGALLALRDAGRIASPLRREDVYYLQRFGILRPQVQWDAGELVYEGQRYGADLGDGLALARIAESLLGEKLVGGVCLHGGFFLGPEDFYQRLRDLPPEQLARIEMHRIDFINQLYGQDVLARVQRRHAAFMNTAMMVTLLGAAISDGLEDGQVVSGVGGQYNFVAMAHALPDARSIIMLRATRESDGKAQSNIRWNYGHTTIPRHLRDVVVTEYGVADLRGQTDAETIKRLLAVTDSRFQLELAEQAKRHGKLEADYEIPAPYRTNLPDALADTLQPWQAAGHLPDFPFGTDFTQDELAMVAVLEKLKHASGSPLELIASAARGWFGDQAVPPGWLERLGLDEAHDLKSLLLRRLFIGNL